MKPKYPFKNLVFQGGGVKTFAYLGALEVLEAYEVLAQIDRTAGASAGAIMAMLVSFRLSAAEIGQLFNQIEFEKLPGLRSARDILGTTSDFLDSHLTPLLANADAINRLFNRFGWYATDYGYQWIQDTIASQCDGNGRATFGDFQKKGFGDLHVAVTDISARASRVFSFQHTPEVAVADALRMSVSIPLFFEAMQFNGLEFGAGNYYADGGVLDNYPLHVFDHPDFQTGSRWHISGVNWETLGCRLYAAGDCTTLIPRRPIHSLLDYIEALLETVLEAQVVAFDHNKVDQQRTININDHCVLATDFHVRPGSESTQYHDLVQSGREEAKAYLDGYVFPSHNLWQWAKRTWLRR